MGVTLTPNQVRAVAAAPPRERQQLKATYSRQMAGNAKSRSRTPAPRRGHARLQNMPRASNVPRGIMPDMSKGNWGQTPASSNIIAPRGFGYYDAFEHDPFSVATHMSIGPATPILATTVCSEGLVTKKPFPLASSNLEAGAILLIVQPAPTAVQAKAFECSSNVDSAFLTATSHYSPQLQADPPDNAIPTRCSLRFRNWTQHVGVGGIVRVLRMTTGVALAESRSTNEELANFCQSIRTHARTRTYGGDELLDTHQKNCTIVDQSKSTWFTDFGTPTNVDQLPWSNSEGWDQDGGLIGSFTVNLHDPAYTPIAILFEPFVAAVSGGTVGNKYEVSVRSQFLGHYAQGTMLANMAVDPPTAPDKLSHHRNREEAKGSILEKVGNAIRDGASWGWNHKSTIVGMAKPFFKAAPVLF